MKQINQRHYNLDRHCENGFISWRDGKNHQKDVATSYATASRCVTTVPFSWRDGQNHQLMWPPAMQQHPGASLRFHCLARRTESPKRCGHQLCNSIQVRHYGSFFLARRTESPTDVTTSYATASRCVTTVPFSWRDGQNHQMMWPPAMQQQPRASLRFHFVVRRIESPRAGTRYCVQHLIHQMSAASLARLGHMAPCPLHYLKKGEEGRKRKRRKFYIYPDVTHTHTLARIGSGRHTCIHYVAVRRTIWAFIFRFSHNTHIQTQTQNRTNL